MASMWRAGQLLAQGDRVSEGQYQQANRGNVVPLHYLPSDPTVHALGARVEPDYLWLLMSLLCFIITGVYYLFGREAR